MSQGFSYLRSMCLIYRGRSRAQTRMKQLNAIANADRISATRQDANRYTQSIHAIYVQLPRFSCIHVDDDVYISCRFWSAQAHENTKN